MAGQNGGLPETLTMRATAPNNSGSNSSMKIRWCYENVVKPSETLANYTTEP